MLPHNATTDKLHFSILRRFSQRFFDVFFCQVKIGCHSGFGQLQLLQRIAERRAAFEAAKGGAPAPAGEAGATISFVA